MGVLSCKTTKRGNKDTNNSFILKIENNSEIRPDYITLKIHVCGIDNNDKKLYNIFSNKINDIGDKSKGDLELHQSVLYWIIKLYSKELNETTFNSILEEIINDRDSLNINIKQNAILYFEEDPNEFKKKEIFLKIIEEAGYVYRPRIVFITKKKSKFNFTDNRFITNIIYNDDSQEGQKALFDQIISTIWNIDCYFNERYNEIIKFNLENAYSINIFKGLEDNSSNYSLNIFLTGLSRAGKSTFINLMKGKLSALESTDKESVTTKLTEYIIIPSKEDIKESEDKTEGNNFSIKLIDSPGMVFDFNDQFKNKETVLNSMKEAFENTSLDKLDIVLFFYNEGNNLENTKEILKILNEKALNVLFIINRSVDDEEYGQNKEITATISFLKKNNLINLINQENFIPCNLKSSKKFPFYGMKEIWKRIYNLFINKNDQKSSLMNDELKKKMKKYLKDLDKTKDQMDIDTFKYEENLNEIKKLISKIKLFSKFNNDNILKKCFDMTQSCFNSINKISLSNNFENIENIEIKYIFVAILYYEINKIYAIEINNDNNFYKITTKFNEYDRDDINEKKLKKKDKKKKDSTKKKDGKASKKEKGEINQEEIDKLRKRKKTIFKKINEICENEQNILDIAKKFKDNIKLELNNDIYDFSTVCLRVFEEELKAKNYIPFYLKYYNIYNNCFKFIEELSKKENWENYEAEYINVITSKDEQNLINGDINISNGQNLINEVNQNLENKNEEKKINNSDIDKKTEKIESNDNSNTINEFNNENNSDK